MIAAVLALPGCSGGEPGGAGPATVPTVSSPPLRAAPAPLPFPEALTAVLYRLADPEVPGTDKVSLVEGATADNAGALDKFATALRDGGYAPVTFDAHDVAWSERNPANAVATVNVSGPDDGGGFSFPMEFTQHQGAWQLSRQTAATLLAFGTPQAGPAPTPTPPS